MGQQRLFNDHSREKWALVHANGRRNSNLAIFVHGFMGQYLGTWGLLPDLLRNHADGDPIFKGWDFLFLGYQTFGLAGVKNYLDIAQLIATQWTTALAGKGNFAAYGVSYNQIALVGHSLGTLGVRQLLADPTTRANPDPIKTVMKIGFYGSPIAGSYLARLGSLFAPIGYALRPGCNEMQMLYNQVKSAHTLHPWPTISLLMSPADMVVGSAMAGFIVWPGDSNPPKTTVLGHLAMCKPDTWKSGPINYLRDILQ